MSNQLETKNIVDDEYLIPVGEVIYSTTDPAGRIRTFNRAFLDTSGYTPEELIGKTHAVLRNDDMPEIVYDDMWDTITSGNTWSGVLKNKRKDGFYYWVDMSITPIIEDGFISGYAAIGYSITRDKSKRVEDFYSNIKNGTSKYQNTRSRLKGLSNINHRTLMDRYLMSVFLLIVTYICLFLYNSHINSILWFDNIIYVFAGFISFLLWSIHKIPILEEDTEVYKIIKDLASGKFRNKFFVKSRYSPYLDILRIRNGNTFAMLGDCDYSKTLNTVILDNVSGGVVITDQNFNISDYNLIASNTLTKGSEIPILSDPSSRLEMLSGANLSKYIKNERLEVLKKREALTDVLSINDQKYRTSIHSIKVKGDIKGWVFVFYKIDENGNVLNNSDRRQR